MRSSNSEDQRRRCRRLPPLTTSCSELEQCSEGGLHFAGDLTGHEGMVRQLRFSLPDQPQLLHSCGADGTVRGWDSRAGQQVER
jgi:WD40 repeat protein